MNITAASPLAPASGVDAVLSTGHCLRVGHGIRLVTSTEDRSPGASVPPDVAGGTPPRKADRELSNSKTLRDYRGRVPKGEACGMRPPKRRRAGNRNNSLDVPLPASTPKSSPSLDAQALSPANNHVGIHRKVERSTALAFAVAGEGAAWHPSLMSEAGTGPSVSRPSNGPTAGVEEHQSLVRPGCV